MEKMRKGEDEEREKMQVREKVGRSRNIFFPTDLWLRKSRLAKAAAEPSGQMRDEQLPAVVARSTFGSQTSEKLPVLGHFWKSRCRKSASVVARSKFSSQHVQSTSMSDQVGSGYVEKCTPLWRVARFQVKSVKE